MNPRFSVADVADRLNVGREEARGLVRFLVAAGLAEFKGERRSEGRGKAEHVYAFVDDFERLLASKLKRAKLV